MLILKNQFYKIRIQPIIIEMVILKNKTLQCHIILFSILKIIIIIILKKKLIIQQQNHLLVIVLKKIILFNSIIMEIKMKFLKIQLIMNIISILIKPNELLIILIKHYYLNIQKHLHIFMLVIKLIILIQIWKKLKK